MNDELRVRIFRKASLCRNFEEIVFDFIKQGKFRCPIYLSAGHEFVSATISCLLNEKPLIFAQHRAHHTYLSFGGDVVELIDELLGRPTGCSGGMGGSASIQSKQIGMFGHDGLMGSQIPIAVGACLSSNRLTLGIMGDASAEEDYVMAAVAWAGSKRLPILFIVEDNNFSILTEKKVRRNWEYDAFANSVNVKAFNISDDPEVIYRTLSSCDLRQPTLLNINVSRWFYHAGAGIDDYDKIDRYQMEMEKLGAVGSEIHETTKSYLKDLWQERLEKQ